MLVKRGVDGEFFRVVTAKMQALATSVAATTALLAGTVGAQPAPERTITETSIGVAIIGSTEAELAT